MKIEFLSVPVIVAFLLSGCAGSPEVSGDDSSPAAISMPGHSDNPPVTMSGYMDTSTTTQIK